MSEQEVVNKKMQSLDNSDKEKIHALIKEACGRKIKNEEGECLAINSIEVFKKYFNPKEPILNINDPIWGKWTPLVLAVYFQKTEEVNALLKLGANPNQLIEKNLTPLHIAATNGKVSICSALITKGADPDAKDDNLITPLINACENNHMDVVKLLLPHKPNIMHKDINGSTCLDHAMAQERYNIVRYINYYYLENNVPLKGGNGKRTKI